VTHGGGRVQLAACGGEGVVGAALMWIGQDFLGGARAAAMVDGGCSRSILDLICACGCGNSFDPRVHYGKKRALPCVSPLPCGSARQRFLYRVSAERVHGKEKNYCTAKRLTTHGKEPLHGKTTNGARQRTIARQNN
jgi:hypothetical protein